MLTLPLFNPALSFLIFFAFESSNDMSDARTHSVQTDPTRDFYTLSQSPTAKYERSGCGAFLMPVTDPHNSKLSQKNP